MLYYKFYHQFPNAAYHFFIFLELMTLQDIETIYHWQMSGKEDILFMHSRILLNHKKKEILLFWTTWMNI